MIVNVSYMNLNLTALLPGHDWADCPRQRCKLAAPVSFLCNWMKWQGVVHFYVSAFIPSLTVCDFSHDVIAVVHVTEASVWHPPENKGCKTAQSDGCWGREDIWRCLTKWCIITLSRCSPSLEVVEEWESVCHHSLPAWTYGMMVMWLLSSCA